MTVRKWVVHWQEIYDRPRSCPTTYAAHDYVFKNHILPGLGGRNLDELTEVVVGGFLDNRKRLGSHRPESADYPGLSDETMRHIHRLLQQCLDQAVEDCKMEKNPARAFHYAKPKAVKANVLSALEIEDYLDAAARLGYVPMFTLALTAGLREGELIALKWSDLNVLAHMLTIHEGRSVECRELVEYAGEGTNYLPTVSDGATAGAGARKASQQPLYVSASRYAEALFAQYGAAAAQAGDGAGQSGSHPLRRPAAHLRRPRAERRHGCPSAHQLVRPPPPGQHAAGILHEYLPMKVSKKPLCAPCEASAAELQTAAEKIHWGWTSDGRKGLRHSGKPTPEAFLLLFSENV